MSTEDNPYEEDEAQKPKTTRRRSTKEKSTFKLIGDAAELPNIAEKITIGTAGIGKVVTKFRPITGYVVIHESDAIGKNLDKALRELAKKNPAVRKVVMWFAAVGEGASFLEPFSYIAVAVYMEQAIRSNPDDPMIVKCFEYLKNSGIDLEKQGLIEVAQEQDVSENGLKQRQQTELERLLAEQQRQQS